MLLNQYYELSLEQIEFYQKNRFIKLKNVFDAETLAFYGEKISQKVQELNTNKDPLDQRDTYGKAFLQIFNLWREDSENQRFCFVKKTWENRSRTNAGQRCSYLSRSGTF